MTKPASYPFLAIAKKYGVDYGDVLLVAQWLRQGGSLAASTAIRTVPGVWSAIVAAHDEQQAIRDGLIDWQTGEPV